MKYCRYHQYQKERRELRKRNLQAQTNIAQYLRKHNIDQMIHDAADKSQSTLYESYIALLAKLEAIADTEAAEKEE
jgi:hypothetical protein